MDVTEGWRNVAASSAAMENDSQLMKARSDACVTVTCCVPSPAINASPASTSPPRGLAQAVLTTLASIAASATALAHEHKRPFDRVLNSA